MFASIPWFWVAGFFPPLESYPALFYRVIKNWSNIVRKIMSHILESGKTMFRGPSGNLVRWSGTEVKSTYWPGELIYFRLWATMFSARQDQPCSSVGLQFWRVWTWDQSSKLFWHLRLMRWIQCLRDILNKGHSGSSRKIFNSFCNVDES